MEALIIVAHGSRQAGSGEVMERIRRDVAEIVSCPVYLTYLQFQHPNLKEIITQLEKEGVHTITVVPMFLSLGVHVLEDIPITLQDIRRRYPHVRLFLAPPLGYDRRLVDILLDRLRGELREVI